MTIDRLTQERLDYEKEIERLRALLLELAGEESLSNNQYISDLMHLRRQNRLMREALDEMCDCSHPSERCRILKETLEKLNEKGGE